MHPTKVEQVVWPSKGQSIGLLNCPWTPNDFPCTLKCKAACGEESYSETHDILGMHVQYLIYGVLYVKECGVCSVSVLYTPWKPTMCCWTQIRFGGKRVK